MRIIIKKIKYRASARFWVAVKEQNKNKFALDKFDISQNIFDSIHSLPKKMPPYRKLPEAQKKIVRNIYDAFGRLWENINETLTEFLESLKPLILKEIG